MLNTLQDIYTAGQRLYEQGSLENTYENIINEARELVNAEHGSIVLLKEDGSLERVYTTSPILRKIKTRKRGYTYKAIKNQEVYVVDTRKLSKVHPLVKLLGATYAVYVPLIFNKQAVGVMALQAHQNEEFTPEQIHILKLFGSMASANIITNQLFLTTKHALETRDLFISLASHELRTPLTSINGYVQLLYSKLGDKETSEGRWIKELSWETLRLTNLVKELLEINQIKSGNLKFFFKECKLRDIVKRALVEVSFTHPHRKIVFCDELDKSSDKIIADFDKILQTITNLVDNAVKFSSPESEITLSLKSKDSRLVISVVDRGVGIDPKDLPRVFAGFYKGANNHKEGMGLGLYLSKHIIDQHKGEIKVSSQKNHSTKIDVILPGVKQ